MKLASMASGKPQYPLLATAIVLINAAVLTVLLFGPNAAHPNVALMRIGMAAVGVGIVLLFLAAMRSRTNRRPF